jgi:hypothetical protein
METSIAAAHRDEGECHHFQNLSWCAVPQIFHLHLAHSICHDASANPTWDYRDVQARYSSTSKSSQLYDISNDHRY